MAKKQFSISVCRIGYATNLLLVWAETQKQAEKKALNDAGDYSFSEHDADYILADEPTNAETLASCLKKTEAQLNLVLNTLKVDLPLLLGKDKDLDKKISKILKKG